VVISFGNNEEHNGFGISDRINRAVSISIKILNDLKDIHAANPQRLRVITLFASYAARLRAAVAS